MEPVKLTSQQGDVLLRKVKVIPQGERKVISKRRCVVAEGEVTGHCHAVEEDDAELIRIGDRMLLNLPSGGTITHQTHRPQKLSPGVYDIGIVQEYDYFSQMARPVQD